MSFLKNACMIEFHEYAHNKIRPPRESGTARDIANSHTQKVDALKEEKDERKISILADDIKREQQKLK